MRYFTVVGSRKTPAKEAEILRDFSERLLRAGWTGRSGLSGEADLALNRALDRYDGLAELYIPWDRFNDYTHGALDGRVIYPKRLGNDAKASAMVAELHPVWASLSRGAKALHTRNAYQVLGKDLATPSDVLMCWALVNRAGQVQGGTATAYNLAVQHGVPVFNLAVPGQLAALDTWIESNVNDVSKGRGMSKSIIFTDDTPYITVPIGMYTGNLQSVVRGDLFARIEVEYSRPSGSSMFVNH